MPTNDIKKIYNDALYWATAKKSKDKDYHLTRTQEAILRKLIHYDVSNPKITYSNQVISDHTFIDAEVLRKEIPKLVKKGFISSASIVISDVDGIKKRRTIFIKWDFIQEVLNGIPKATKVTKVEANTITKPLETKEPVNTKAVVQPIDEVKESIETEVETVSIPKEEIEKDKELEVNYPQVELTKEKANWLFPLIINKNPNYLFEDMQKLPQKLLVSLFYGDDGCWNVDNCTIENINLWRKRDTLNGKCFISNNLNKSKSLGLKVDEFNQFLSEKGIEFKDFNQSHYDDIMVNGLPKVVELAQG